MMARKTELADALDKHIGGRIRECRENLGMTQADLARRAGVSYQQIHKYEQGSNRISAGRLGHIASILQHQVETFYSGFGNAHSVELQDDANDESRLCLEVARNFRQISNTSHQKALTMLVRVLAQQVS